MMLSACSLLDEVNNSLDYVNEAKNYINSLSDFAEEAPQQIQDAAVDPEVRQDLEDQLNTLVEEINEFNSIEAPAIAEDIHQDIVTKNEALIDEINTAMENGELALEKLENSEIINTVNDVTSLLESIEKLEQ
jgi:type I site-specific restriction-modification system R (restriction) subunit